jgi:hypothetical protein
MNAHDHTPTAMDLAAEANGLTTGLGIITMTFFPFALPGLLLALPFVLPLLPLLVAGGVLYLLARAILLPVRLVRSAWRARPESAERAGHDARRHAVVERAHG